MKTVKFKTIYDSVPLEVYAVLDGDKFDEFTVYAGGVIINEVLSEKVADILKKQAKGETNNDERF